MDCAILLHFGGSISKQFELVGMRRQVLTFQNTPSFNDLVARVRAVINVECDLWLHGRYDMGGTAPASMVGQLRFSPMSRANQTGVTPKGQNLEISFDRVHFSIFILKRAKIQKKIWPWSTRQGRNRERKGIAAAH
jgi:hypothetical protein